MTTPLLATRDALARALFTELEPLGDGWTDHLDDGRRDTYLRLADRLLVSGVVRDPSTLTVDEAFVERVSRVWVARNHPRRPWRYGDIFPAKGWVGALVAALTEDERVSP